MRKEEEEINFNSIKLDPFIVFQRPSPVNLDEPEDNTSRDHSPDRGRATPLERAWNANWTR
jgi:hypothetical protein